MDLINDDELLDEITFVKMTSLFSMQFLMTWITISHGMYFINGVSFYLY